MVWAVGLVAFIVVVALAVSVGLKVRQRSASGNQTESETDVATASRPPEIPMIGLDSALARATDRSGRPMSEHIDSETQHVDEFRVPDDTGPLLRRALDHIGLPGGTKPDEEQPGDTRPRDTQPGEPGDSSADAPPTDTD